MGYMFRLVNSSKYVAYISQMNICCADVYWSLCYLEQKFVIICDCSKRLLPVLTQYLIQLFNLCAFNTSTRFNKTDNVRINVTMRHIRVTIVAISITYSVCVCVCVCLEPQYPIGHERRMPHIILSSVANPALSYFSILFHTRQDFRKNFVVLQIGVLTFSKTFV